MRMSSAPILTSSSITWAHLFFSTMLLTATQFSSSSRLMVGAFRPGVTTVAAASLSREMLYWQTTYLPAAMTPAIRLAIRSIRGVK